MDNSENNKLAVFEVKHIRKLFHEGEWWFSIIDVIEFLVGGDRPRKYWNDLKSKLISEVYVEVSEKIGQLKMQAPDGKMRLTDCAQSMASCIRRTAPRDLGDLIEKGIINIVAKSPTDPTKHYVLL